MINSRDVKDLRADVRANCEVFLAECKAAGLPVIITQTLRDNEYQATLYAKGRTAPGSIVTNSRTTTFHGAGLAFDIAKNIRGQEYADTAFFYKCAEIGKRIGFSWGGDWKSFVDLPHFQWDGGGIYKHTNAPVMPLYEDDIMNTEKLTDADILALANRIQAVLAKQPQGGEIARELEEAVALGITDGSNPKAFVTRAQAAVMAKRAAK